MVQVRLMLVPNNNLQIAIGDLLVSSHDDSDHEVKHDDLEEVGLAEKDQPDQVDVDVHEDTGFLCETLGVLLEEVVICWEGKLSNGVSECLEEGLLEVVEDQGCVTNFRIDIEL